MNWLSGDHTYSLTHAPRGPIVRVCAAGSCAGTSVRLRGAISSRRPLVETKAIVRPSGENFGPMFMPGRSTIVRGVPPRAATRYTRAEYGDMKPDIGAAEYAISAPSGAHDKLSTN